MEYFTIRALYETTSFDTLSNQGYPSYEFHLDYSKDPPKVTTKELNMLINICIFF